jgi:hypothetical protein
LISETEIWNVHEPACTKFMQAGAYAAWHTVLHAGIFQAKGKDTLSMLPDFVHFLKISRNQIVNVRKHDLQESGLQAMNPSMDEIIENIDRVVMNAEQVMTRHDIMEEELFTIMQDMIHCGTSTAVIMVELACHTARLSGNSA